ncbi:MAG: hypothetical protein KC656_17575, partial [Myxococcales bacterium]|nr:hypothetical protein [Myxococcales bacterium]
MSRVLPFLVLAACAAPDPRVRLEPPPPEVGWVEAAIEPAVATLVREPLATGVRSAVALRGDRVMIEREDGTWIVDAFGDLTPVPFVTGELHDSAIRYHEDSTLWPDGTDLVATEAAGVLRVDPTDTVRRARELDGVARIRDVDCPHGWLCMVETGSETYQIELAPYLEEFPQRLNGGPVTHAVRQHDGGTRASARGDLLSYQGFTTRVVRLAGPVVQLLPDLALTPEGLYTLEDYSLPRR